MPHSGNLHIEYFGPKFGWTTSAKVAQWFAKQYKKYIAANSLKYRAMQVYHGTGENHFNVRSHKGKWFNGKTEIKLPK